MKSTTASNKIVIEQLKQDCPERTYTGLNSTNDG